MKIYFYILLFFLQSNLSFAQECYLKEIFYYSDGNDISYQQIDSNVCLKEITSIKSSDRYGYKSSHLLFKRKQVSIIDFVNELIVRIKEINFQNEIDCKNLKCNFFAAGELKEYLSSYRQIITYFGDEFNINLVFLDSENKKEYWHESIKQIYTNKKNIHFFQLDDYDSTIFEVSSKENHKHYSLSYNVLKHKNRFMSLLKRKVSNGKKIDNYTIFDLLDRFEKILYRNLNQANFINRNINSIYLFGKYFVDNNNYTNISRTSIINKLFEKLSNANNSNLNEVVYQDELFSLLFYNSLLKYYDLTEIKTSERLGVAQGYVLKKITTK